MTDAPPNSIKRCHSRFQRLAYNGLHNLKVGGRFHLGSDALPQDCDMARLWLEGDDLSCLAQSPKCRGAAECEIAIVRAHIQYASYATQRMLQPTVQLVFVQSENFPQRIARIHYDTSTAKRPAQNTRGDRSVRKQTLKRNEAHT